MPLTFEPGRTHLTTETKNALDPLVVALRAHAELRIRVVGHYSADRRSQVEAARRRAAVVKWYLVDGGIFTDRIDTSISASTAPGKVVELQLATTSEMSTREVTPRDVTPRDVAHSDAHPITRDASEMASMLATPTVTSSRQPSAHLDQMFEDARKKRLTIGNDEVGFRGSGSSDLGTRHALDLAFPQPVSTLAPNHRDTELAVERPPPQTRRNVVLPASPEVARVLHDSYAGGLAHCVRKWGLSDGTTSGRVGLSFGIDASGRVVDPSAEGAGTELDSCVRNQMNGWRFPPATVRRGGAATGARFSVTLALQSS